MLRRTAGRAGRKDALLKGSRIEPAGRLVIPARMENPEPGPWPGLDTRFRGYDTALLSFPRKAGIHRSLKASLVAYLRGHDKGRGVGGSPRPEI